MTKLQPGANHSGRDVSAGIEAEPEGVIALDPELAAIWELASPFLKVRDNDAHTLYAFGLACALLDAHPEADAAVVLPAIMLHDIGWSQVPASEVTSEVLAILEAFEKSWGSLSLTDSAEKSGLPLSTGHRLVNELTDWGFLSRGVNGRYQLGIRLWELAQDTGRQLREAAS